MISRALCAFVAVVVIAGPVWADPMDAFYGSFVGTGVASYARDGRTDQRDLDVTVEPAKNGGFRLKWITVTRDDEGGRTGAGVKRRSVEETFLPFDDREGVYVLAPEGGLFKKAELPNPLRGDPMRWATVSGDTLTVYSMAIADDGTSEMQIYHRRLTDKGLKVDFMRLDDEDVELRVFGELVRTE